MKKAADEIFSEAKAAVWRDCSCCGDETSHEKSVKRLNDHLKQWIPVGRFLPHSGAALTLRPLEPQQGVGDEAAVLLARERLHREHDLRPLVEHEVLFAPLPPSLW